MTPRGRCRALEELRSASLKRGWAWKWDGTDLTQVPMGRVECPRDCEFDGMTGLRPPCGAEKCPGFVVDVEGHRTYADPADAILATRRLPG